MTTPRDIAATAGKRLQRLSLALLPPIGALLLQLSVSSLTRHVWFLFFYPAVFLSSWIGGVRAALLATAISVASVLWFVVPPAHSFIKAPEYYFPVAVFATMGILFGVVHDRLRHANRRTSEALVASDRANEALKKVVNERRLFAALVENSSDFIGIADPDGTPVYVNPAGRRMVGLADHPIESTKVPEYYSADQRAFASDVIVKSTVETGHWQGETAFRHWQTEAAIPVSHTHFAIRDPQTGEILGMGTVTRDISDIKRARDEADRARHQLRQANDAIAALVEQAPDGIFVADLDGRYTDVNSAGCRMLGYAREEIIGKTIVDLIPAGGIDQLERERQQLLEGRDQVSEWTLRRKDGTFLPVEVSATILPDGRWQGFVRDISARKQLEDALRASHRDLTLAQSVARVGSWRLDIQRNELRWSDENYRIFGVSPGTPMTYERFLACVHPEDRAAVDRAWTNALRGQPYDIEHRILADGTTKWVREKADLELDAHQTLLGGIGTTHDITDRKRAEDDLRRAEAQATGIVSISADAIISLDEDRRITLFNEGAEKIFGYAKEEVIGGPLDLLIPARLRAIHPQHVERFAAGAEVARRMGERGTPILGLRKNGEEFPADAAISRLEVNGRTIVTVALRDVTEQMRLENEQRFLAEVGAVLSSTLELDSTMTSIGQLATQTLADACIAYILDADGGVRRLKVVTRDPAQAWICEALEQIQVDRSRAPEVWSELGANRSVLMARLSPEQVEAYAQSELHLRALRALAPRSVITAPLFVHQRLVGALTFMSCASARVYGPADVRLAEQVAQRAALAIDNAQLYAHARRALKTRDDVLGIVAHDLRNPLGTILIQAELLRKSGAEPERRSRAGDAIARSAKRMNRLIQDLLDVARMDAGRLSIEQARVSARQVIADAVSAAESLATAAELALEVDVAPDLPEVWADGDRLLQIFENLIGNAIKFTAAGGVITVGAAPSDGAVLFWVADTGSGIPAESLPHVFDRFWQARVAGRHGAGLGLPIVKGIVESHGGRVWVESTPGRGTTVRFTIPTASRAVESSGLPMTQVS